MLRVVLLRSLVALVVVLGLNGLAHFRPSPPDPCAGAWALPVQPASLRFILDCHQAGALGTTLCPPPGSPWRELIAPDELCR